MLTLQQLSCFHFQFLVWSENYSYRLHTPQNKFHLFQIQTTPRPSRVVWPEPQKNKTSKLGKC